MIDLKELTIGQIQEISRMAGCASGTQSPVALGDKVIMRSVTFHLVGEVAEICGQWVRLTQPSWVADSGRWSGALADGKLNEVEKCGDYCWVNLDTVVDIHPWNHKLPTKTK